MEFQDYFVLEVYNRKNPDKLLNRYFYDTYAEALANFDRRKGRGDLAKVYLMTCQGPMIDAWERKE